MSDKLTIFLLAVVAVVLLALLPAIVYRIRRNPREREKRRRLAVNARGRLADGSITEADETAIFYSYSAGGVDYATSQDIGEIRDIIPVRPEQLIGSTVTVKYAMKNPANSIVVCEEWSGLRPGIQGGDSIYDPQE
jgi:hypothetical protein